MPSMLWRSSGSAGRTSAGMIGHRLPRRIECRSRPRERRVLRQVGDRRGEAVDHRRARPLEQVERRRRVGGVRADQRGAGQQRPEQAVGEAADPEERRVGEQHLVVGVAAQLVEVAEVADQRAVLVDHALRGAGGARRVDDHHAVGGSDRCLRRGEHVVVDAGARLEERRPCRTTHPAERGHRRREQRRRSTARRAPGHRLAQRVDVVAPAERPRSRAAARCRRCAAACAARRSSRTCSAAARPRRCGPRPATPTTNAEPFGCSSPTWVPLPAPAASRPLASAADRDDGVGVGEHVVVADQQRVVAAAAARSAGARAP